MLFVSFNKIRVHSFDMVLCSFPRFLVSSNPIELPMCKFPKHNLPTCRLPAGVERSEELPICKLPKNKLPTRKLQTTSYNFAQLHTTSHNFAGVEWSGELPICILPTCRLQTRKLHTTLHNFAQLHATSQNFAGVEWRTSKAQTSNLQTLHNLTLLEPV